MLILDGTSLNTVDQIISAAMEFKDLQLNIKNVDGPLYLLFSPKFSMSDVLYGERFARTQYQGSQIYLVKLSIVLPRKYFEPDPANI
jgi:hypothetical protein